MIVLDKGHNYALNVLDGLSTEKTTLIFVKRFGVDYPGNTSAYPGTTTQEVLRALIDRQQYVNKQKKYWINTICVWLYRIAINLLEYRAAKRHHRPWRFVWKIEKLDVEPLDNHVRYGKTWNLSVSGII